MGRTGRVAGLVIALVGAGCGGSSHSPGASSASHSATSKQLTMAHVCASHPNDLGDIAGAVFAFKDSMDRGDFPPLTSIQERTDSAIYDIKSAAVGATSSNLPAMRAFLQDLDDLKAAVDNGIKYPSAYAGDMDVAKLKADGKAVGCNLG